MKPLILLLLGVFVNHALQAQTTLPDVIETNTTLTKGGSPYIVNNDLFVLEGATLTAEAGVIIKIAEQKVIHIDGNFVADGMEGDSIYFMSLEAGKRWGYITSYNANIRFSYLNVTGDVMFLSASGGDSILISHSKIVSTARGNGEDCIAVHDAGKVIIEYIWLEGAGGTIAEGIKNDAIDLDAMDSIFILHNKVFNFSDDALDIGTNSTYAKISYNVFHHSNFGISVGESTIAYIDNNVSYQNDAGFQVHSGATIYCTNNTLYSNTLGIEAYHSEEGEDIQSGGYADIRNTIFSQTHSSEISTQTSSSVTISYSLSDKEILPGEYNIFDDPEMIDPENGDFRLQRGSPCFNAGEPDGENHRPNIGVLQDPYPDTVYNYLGYTELQVSVFPNPAEDYVVIDIGQRNSGELYSEIFSADGKILQIVDQFTEAGQVRMNTEKLSKGIYFIRITIEESDGRSETFTCQMAKM
jgi:hypothetical protein